MATQKLTWRRIDLPMLPTPRIGAALALSLDKKTALLFGGWNSSVGDLNELWSVDGQKSERQQVSRSPTARVGMCMSQDEAQHSLVMFGGAANGDLLGETWLFDGVGWNHRQPMNSPAPRANATMAYDRLHKLTILFGGTNVNGRTVSGLNDTWAWDGTDWRLQVIAESPPPRFGAKLVYDDQRQSLLLFGGGNGGGLLDDTWTWNGIAWTEQRPTHRPPARADFGMAYHDGRQQVILFGGQVLDGSGTDTWAWDGQDWTQLQPEQSPPLEVAFGAQLIYLPSLQAVVLYSSFRQKTVISDERVSFVERSEVWALSY